MTKKIGDKKLDGVKGTTSTTGVKGTESVSTVGGVKGASAVGGIKKAGAVSARSVTGTMSQAQRETLLRMVEEEAYQLFGNNEGERKKAVATAVKMAVDGGILPDEEDGK